ncbi:MAG: pyruvate formate lyase family protein, partial [candidate division WOR-3 bacterium]
MVSERVKILKDKVRVPPKICIERAYWITESYKETEGQPPIIRRALALKKVLENIPITIDAEELIVGRTGSKIGRCITLAPEVCIKIIRKDMIESDVITVGGTPVVPLTQEEKAKLEEICAYWEGKTLYDIWRSIIPLDLLDPEDLEALGYNQILGPLSGFFIAHFCPDYEKVLKFGLNGIKKRIKERMEKLDLTKIEDFEKWLFYKSAIIALDAVISFANRYAELARTMAEAELNPRRKAELERIAEICSWVPANPARNFHEALQSIWFIYIATWMEAMGPAICLGRLDQILYPWYKKDIEEGKITREEAKELIELLLIKCNEVSLYQPRILGVFDTGAGALPNITIGGVTKDGRCAVNDLSYLFLEAEDEVLLAFEEIVVRVHNSTPESFLMKAVKTAKLGRGKLKFVGDNRSIEMLLSVGKSIEEARDYCISGCFMISVPGKSIEIAPVYVNMAYFLELALNNGISRISGKRVGIETGDPRKFKSFDEVFNAYKKQVEAFFKRFLPFVNIYVWIYAKYAPYPLTSCLFDGPIERGVDLLNGGILHMTEALWLVGLVNVADSLAAIKRIVFEENKITMEDLIEALDKNFEGYEHILYLLKSAPKFGNDDDYVDLILNDVITHVYNVVNKYKGFAGAKFTLAGGAVTMNMAAGKFTGALPDGRKAGEPLAEGGLSPHQGRNVMGPLATFRSIAKLDLTKLANGTAVNMKFNPDAIKDEAKMKKFISLLRTYFESGGQHVQFNIISNTMLREAQKFPEKYRDLLVRVATY